MTASPPITTRFVNRLTSANVLPHTDTFVLAVLVAFALALAYPTLTGAMLISGALAVATASTAWGPMPLCGHRPVTASFSEPFFFTRASKALDRLFNGVMLLGLCAVPIFLVTLLGLWLHEVALATLFGGAT